MNDPRAAQRRSLWVHTLSWLALALLAIDLARLLPVRLDLTRSGRYSLADASREVVARLDKPLVARVWFTEHLDPPYHTHRTALLDLLAALDASSSHGVEVVARDPGEDPEQRAAAAADGIRPLPYSFRSADRTETRSVFLGATLLYGDRRVAIDALPSIDRMEYDVVRAIDALSTDAESRPTIGWWTAHGEPDPAGATAGTPLHELWGRLGARATLATLDTPDAPIPDDVDVLIVAGPRSGVPPYDLVHLDQFVMRGGRLLLFVSSFAPDFARMTPVDVDHGLFGWLGHAGVKLGRDLVIDRLHAERLSLPAPGSRRWVQVVHPLALVTTRLDRTLVPVRGLPRLVLPFASTVTPADPLPEGIEAQVWATTDEDAGALKGLRTLDPAPLQQSKLSSEVPGPHPLIVSLSGTFASFYGDRELPSRTAGQAPFRREELTLRSAPARIVVVGSTDAVANDLDLVVNAVDWLNEDPLLIGLRSRWAGDPELPAPTRAVAIRTKVLMVGVPFAALGLAAFLVGRRR
jgi:ABC-type uncharacterized transport system